MKLLHIDINKCGLSSNGTRQTKYATCARRGCGGHGTVQQTPRDYYGPQQTYVKRRWQNDLDTFQRHWSEKKPLLSSFRNCFTRLRNIYFPLFLTFRVQTWQVCINMEIMPEFSLNTFLQELCLLTDIICKQNKYTSRIHPGVTNFVF